MRFKLVFDKGLVQEKYVKAWFVLDEEHLTTDEVNDQIKLMFKLKQGIYLELDGFIIPGNQILGNIVKVDEIVNVKQGKFTIGSELQYTQVQEYKKNDEGFNGSKNKAENPKKSLKIEQKRNIKSEESSSSEELNNHPRKHMKSSSDSSSSEIVTRKKNTKYISESSDSLEKIAPVTKQKPVVKPTPKAVIPIKSVIKLQPEPEFIPKPVYKYNILEFAKCPAQELQVGDEILYKTLEIKDDLTPGISDYKVYSI